MDHEMMALRLMVEMNNKKALSILSLECFHELGVILSLVLVYIITFHIDSTYYII